MSQQRKTAVVSEPELDEPGGAGEPRATRAANAIPEERILDAAYELFLAVGMRRMNMAAIARRSGVSRATLYRRWPNVHAVVGALTTREFAAATAHAFVADAPTARAALVGGVVTMVRTIRLHPLMRKIVEVDPEFLLPYLVHRRGTSTNQQLNLIEIALRAGWSDGSMRDGNPALQARAIWLTAWSFMLTGPVLADDLPIEALDDQLGELLDRYLTP